MATFVLVHGAWHGGWCWKRVRPLLRAAGHDVFTPTMTGLGERAHLARHGIGLATHVQDIVNVLEYEDLTGVVLVGHSYGGAVVTGVAGEVPRRIGHLVYLDAYVPEEGEALLDCMPAERAESLRSTAVTEDGLQRIPVEAGWAILDINDPGDEAWVKPRLVPHPLRTLEDRLESAWHGEGVRRSYILCTGRSPRPMDQVGARIRRQPVWQYRELPTGHDAMVTMPGELAAVLLELAG